MGGALFSMVSNEGTRGNSTKPHTGGSDRILGEISLSRGWSNWNRLPRETFDALCLSVFKTHLDNSLR